MFFSFFTASVVLSACVQIKAGIPVKQKGKEKVQANIYCYNCAKKGHHGYVSTSVCLLSLKKHFYFLEQLKVLMHHWKYHRLPELHLLSKINVLLHHLHFNKSQQFLYSTGEMVHARMMVLYPFFFFNLFAISAWFYLSCAHGRGCTMGCIPVYRSSISTTRLKTWKEDNTG